MFGLRSRNWLILVLVGSFFVTVSWPMVPRALDWLLDLRGRAYNAWVCSEDLEPPAPLAPRKDDVVLYPREGFAFIYETGGDFRISSLENMISCPDTTLEMVASAAELDSIHRLAVSIRYFDRPEPHPDFQGNYGHPQIPVKLVLRAGNVTKELSWNAVMIHGGPRSDEWKRLDQLLSMIGRVI